MTRMRRLPMTRAAKVGQNAAAKVGRDVAVVLVHDAAEEDVHDADADVGTGEDDPPKEEFRLRRSDRKRPRRLRTSLET